MAKNSIEIKLESSSKEGSKVVKHDAFGRREQIRESEAKSPVRSATSETAQELKSVAKELKEASDDLGNLSLRKGWSKEDDLVGARPLTSEEQPSTVKRSPVASDHEEPKSVIKGEEKLAKEVQAQSPSVSERKKSEDLIDTTGFAEADTGRTVKHPRKPVFPVGPEGHQWRMEQDPETKRFTRRVPLISFRGHPSEKQTLEDIAASMPDRKEKPVSLASRAVQAMRSLDRGEDQSDGPLAIRTAAGRGGDADNVVRSTMGAAESGEPREKKVPVSLARFGKALSLLTGGVIIAAKGFQALDNFLSQAAEEIQAFAPDIIVEKVNRSMMLLEKRMERAGEVGTQLATFERSRTRLISEVEDFKTKFIKIATPVATVAMDFLAQSVRNANQSMTWMRKVALTTREAYLEFLRATNRATEEQKKEIDQIRALLSAIDKNTKKEEDPGGDHMDKVLTLLAGQKTNIPGFTRVPGSVASGL